MTTPSSADIVIKPGVLVEVLPTLLPEIQRRGEQAIVLRPEAAPSASWLREQVDERLRQHRDRQWWCVMPLTGGALLLPQAILQLRGTPTRDQILMAVDHASESGRRSI